MARPGRSDDDGARRIDHVDVVEEILPGDHEPVSVVDDVTGQEIA